MKLTPLAKLLVTLIVFATVGIAVYKNTDWLEKVAPKAQVQSSNIPPVAKLPDAPDVSIAKATEQAPGCADKPEVRFYHWAWNAQAGLMLATGGKVATKDSAMCQAGVNLRLIREDNADTMQSLMLSFAEEFEKGTAQPKKGAHFVAIMGDGSANFLKGLNDRVAKVGKGNLAMIVGAAGYSRGEDKFMGPQAWKDDPQKARGGLVAGYLRDGDWNIALKWLGDNQLPNNPAEGTYDPDALNWVNATDYIDAAEKYISGFCADLKNTKTGKTEKHCVDGVVTWTPGDVNVAEKKGGLVSIVSTREYRWQMPCVIIGHKKWMAANRKTVSGMLQAIFNAGDKIKNSDDALREASAVSANVYNERDAAYWYKYFRMQTERDKTGHMVELGGSSVNNLADNEYLFGLQPGSANLLAAVYTTFADLVKSQYPQSMPSYYPFDQVVDTSYIKELLQGAKKGTADVPQFEQSDRMRQVISRKAWDIQFNSGLATFTPSAQSQLAQLLRDTLVAGGAMIEIHGHTDNVGTVDSNQKLSEARAFAVRTWLEQRAQQNFPAGRVKVFAHGQSEPLAANATPDGRAKNRRVEIILGTN